MANPSRREWMQMLGATTALVAVGVWTGDALAKQSKAHTRVTWSSVELPEGKLKQRRERVLRSELGKESRAAEWGEHASGKLEATVKVVEFEVQERNDVVRVICTAVGKLKGGPSVRTHFSIGDHPTRQVKLEQMVLTLVARGIVTRLAAIARNRAVPKAAS